MKNNFTCRLIASGIFSITLLMVSCSKKGDAQQNNKPAVSPTSQITTASGTTYTQVWADEFTGTAVNSANWAFDPGAGQNGELEYYQAANATVSNGNLVITAKKENAGGMAYTSARMNTLNKVSSLYGRIEARIKMPLGQGLWPAFWMLGTDFPKVGWPDCGEIDIMEHVNADNLIYGTIHWDNGANYGLTTTTTPADYHVYAVEWNANSIRWYVDSTLYVTANIANNINNTGAFQKPFYIILNMAVGGQFPGNKIDDTKLPAQMLVDYVRVYKQTATK
ncbi:family 16 glycosylhydrolase [Pedobacter sp. L105]|uniref:glycoside hydrolase family 16 protein n=1 Tax=Pedobacter sp. L105 TaxID=1641871 RepID=UPI00131DF9F1|nr:glycoside hydrolase family 16 protein [Pedobacter sp. L105]